MKKVLALCLLISNVSLGQIYVQSPQEGSIVITPKGLQGKSNPGSDTTNIVMGHNALHNNTFGLFNVAIGTYALEANTWGGGNTGIGQTALVKNTSGAFNTANGIGSLYQNVTGIKNTAVGASALHSNIEGNNNSAFGVEAGGASTLGNFNTFVGYQANTSGYNFNNSTAIGANSVANASNKVRIGNDQVTSIEGAVPFSTPSDRRLKQNVAPSLLGLSFISRLSPMSYTYIADKTNVRRDGLIAQDVEKVMQELGVEFSGLQKSPDGTYSLAYSDFVMPLVNAAKELKQQNEQQQTKIEELEARLSALEELKAEITKLKADNALRNADKK